MRSGWIELSGGWSGGAAKVIPRGLGTVQEGEASGESGAVDAAAPWGCGLPSGRCFLELGWERASVRLRVPRGCGSRGLPRLRARVATMLVSGPAWGRC
jgi:hypothetical protein